MKPSLRLPSSLARDATVLAQGAQVFCREQGSSSDWDAFKETLTRTLTRGDPDESRVLGSAVRALSARRDDDAYRWLLHEVEMECELQFLPDPRTGREKACVLFAFPIAAPMDMPLPQGLYANEAFAVMHDILEEAKILDDQSEFRLLPRLFTAQELRGRSKSEIRTLTRSLGTQLLADRSAVLELEDGVFTGIPPMLEDYSIYEAAQLRYLVGVAVTEEEFLDDLFCELNSPDVPKDSGTDPRIGPATEAEREAGWLTEGSWWSHPFCEKLAECAMHVYPDFTICAPRGFHDDMRMGLELLREQDARFQCLLALEANSLAESDVVVEEYPLSTPDGQVLGIAAYLVDTGDNDRLYAAITWPTFHHETLDDAVEQLHAMLNAMQILPADEKLSSDLGQTSYLLH